MKQEKQIIKFRCLGLESGKWHYYDELQGRQCVQPDESCSQSCQFTGLVDKNGTEVYQGDFLRFEADKEGCGSTSYGGIVRVSVQTCGFSLFLVKPTIKELDAEWRRGGDGFDISSLWYAEDPKNIEVIGNIYQNPELAEIE